MVYKYKPGKTNKYFLMEIVLSRYKPFFSIMFFTITAISSNSYAQSLCKDLFINSLQLNHANRERILSEINSKYATRSSDISIVGNLIKNFFISTIVNSTLHFPASVPKMIENPLN